MEDMLACRMLEQYRAAMAMIAISVRFGGPPQTAVAMVGDGTKWK